LLVFPRAHMYTFNQYAAACTLLDRNGKPRRQTARQTSRSILNYRDPSTLLNCKPSIIQTVAIFC